MDKLTINELKGYLGTGLKFYDIYSEQIFGEIEKIDLYLGEITLFKGMSTIEVKIDYVNQSEHNYKPLLYPLSSLTEYRDDLGFVPIEELKKSGSSHVDWVSIEANHWIKEYGHEKWLSNLPFGVIEKLYEWHINLHNLIDRNLAINIKTLKQ